MLLKSCILSPLFFFALISGAAAGESSMGEWRRVVSPRGSIRTVAMSSGHQVILYESGLIECRGLNEMGECNVPEMPGGVKDIAAGDGFSMALLEDGTVRFWGDPDFSVDGMKAKLIAATGDNSYATGLAVLGEGGHIHCRHRYTYPGQSLDEAEHQLTGDAMRLVMCGDSPAVLRTDGSLIDFRNGHPANRDFEDKGPFRDLGVAFGCGPVLIAADGRVLRAVGSGVQGIGTILEKLAEGGRALCQQGGDSWTTAAGDIQKVTLLPETADKRFPIGVKPAGPAPENLRQLLTDDLAVLKDGSLAVRGTLPFGTHRFDELPRKFVKLAGNFALDSEGKLTSLDGRMSPVSETVADIAAGDWGTLILLKDGTVVPLPDDGRPEETPPNVPRIEDVRDGMCVAVGDHFAAVGHRDGGVSVWNSADSSTHREHYARTAHQNCSALTAGGNTLVIHWREIRWDGKHSWENTGKLFYLVSDVGLIYTPVTEPDVTDAIQIAVIGDLGVALDKEGRVTGWGRFKDPNVVPPVLPEATAVTIDQEGVTVALADGRVVMWDNKVTGTVQTGERLKYLQRRQVWRSSVPNRVEALTEEGGLRIWVAGRDFEGPWRLATPVGLAGPGNLSRRAEQLEPN